MQLLDLCCKAGGSATGYARAGFDVIGVDKDPQPHYPYRFYQEDALAFLVRYGQFFDAIHASFPCQAFTAYRRKGHGVGDGYPDLIGPGRMLLQAAGRPYVIENVPGAPLRDPITLCGSSFGLDVRRHRLFETNWPVPPAPRCRHDEQAPRFPPATNRTNPRRTVEIGVWRIPLDVQQQAMGGLGWMTREELSEAVPPSYTEWLGGHLMEWLRQRQDRAS